MKSEKLIIADSSPLIGLARIGHLQVLRQLATRVVVPAFVWQEVTTAKSDAPGAAEVLSQKWIEVIDADPEMTAKLLKLVDRGEAEAIALAQAMSDGLLLIDERRGRKIAESLGIRRTGILGLLALAKKAGIVYRVRPLVEALAANNIYMRPEIVSAILAEVGE